MKLGVPDAQPALTDEDPRGFALNPAFILFASVRGLKSGLDHPYTIHVDGELLDGGRTSA